MTTIPSVVMPALQELQPVASQGQWRGFANLLRNELRRWWGTRRWLVHLLVWIGTLNGLVLLVGLTEDPTSPAPLYVTLAEVFLQAGAFATGVGAVTTAQGAIIGERQLGTAAWLLSKPVARGAFVLAKFVAYGLSFVGLAILLPAAAFYGESLALAGQAPRLVGLLGAVGVAAAHTLFYLALTLMLGTLFSGRGPVAGIALGVLFAGFVLTKLLPPALLLGSPWLLDQLAVGLALGSALPAIWPIPLLASGLWVLIFLGVALWRFGREEF